MTHPFTQLSRATRAAAAAALLAASLATGVFASPSVGVGTDASLGNILVDDHGMTLYRFTRDQPNASTCYDACAADWPPVLVDAVPAVQNATLAAQLGLTSRTDGSQQLTFAGSPLYYFVDDSHAGDTNGQAAGGVWFVVNP